ncbi:MAG TPA: hypothetical protein VFR35_00695, partial [Actinoplanes sp.]|nr:hypothetical protein [Actinoplanes sp.]
VGFFIVADERRVHAESQSPDEPAPWAISSRAVDPEPLRIDEIFPGTEISLISGEDPYRVTMTHVDSECEIATTGGLGRVLAEQDCTQVIRAGITAPYGGYLVTAGVFNLADEAGAAAAGQQVRELVESGGGTFATMSAGATPGSPPQTDSDAQIGWRGFGHYLVYCVIARPDGQAIAADDPYARRITADLLETYLAREKLAGRALT